MNKEVWILVGVFSGLCILAYQGSPLRQEHRRSVAAVIPDSQVSTADMGELFGKLREWSTGKPNEGICTPNQKTPNCTNPKPQGLRGPNP